MKQERHGLDDIRQAQQRAHADKRKLIARMRSAQAAAQEERKASEHAAQEKAERFKFIDVEKSLTTLREFSFHDTDQDADELGSKINRPTLELTRDFLRALRRDRSFISVLQWPIGQRDTTLVHPLAMLALIGTVSTTQTNGYAWCPSLSDFRTLYFPWRGPATGSYLRDILVERSGLIDRNKFHLTRSVVGQPEASEAMAQLHRVIGHLTALKTRDGLNPYLAHPNLYEIFPIFSALGLEGAPRPFANVVNNLFGRVAYGAHMTDRGGLGLPDVAPFGLFGVCPRSNIRRALQSKFLSVSQGRPPDICILDLGPPGLSRIGLAWEEGVATFLEALEAEHPGTPIFAVTQDIYVHRRLTALARDRDQTARPEPTIIVRSSNHPLKEDPEVGDVTPIEITFHSTGGDGSLAIRAMSEAAREVGDPRAAGLIRRKIGELRRAVSLPCGLNVAYKYLEATEGQDSASDFLEHRSETSIATALKEATQLSGTERDRAAVAKALAAVQIAFKGLEDDTPIGNLIIELERKLIRKASWSIIAFASERDRRLGRNRLLTDSECGEMVQRRLDDGLLQITTCNELPRVLLDIERTPQRNQWKRLVLVGCHPDQLSVILGHRWLPADLIVLCDRDLASHVATRYAYLAQQPALAGTHRIGARLAVAAAKAREEAKAREVPTIELELDNHEAVARDESVIDLAGSSDDDEGGDILEFELQSGRTLRARYGTALVAYDETADVNPFARVLGRDIRPGRAIVVPDLAFVTEARGLLPVKVLARGWVNIYHSLVEAGLGALPGQTLAAKARYVQQQLAAAGARQLSEQAIVDWLKVADHKKASAEVIRPHAPMRYRAYMTFAKVIGIEADMAEKIWRGGIEPLRIDRRRAGSRMAHAFSSVLVDPHGCGARLSDEVRDKLRELRRRAREHVDGVVKTKTVGREDTA